MDYPKFGEVFFARLRKEGNVQGGNRPVIIIQNDIGNKHSPTVRILPLSAQIHKAGLLPTHVIIDPNAENGLREKSIALVEQVNTINKSDLVYRLGKLDKECLKSIGRADKIESSYPTD